MESNKTIIGKNGSLEINEKGLIKILGGEYSYLSSKPFKDLEDDEIAYISEAYLDEFDEDKFYYKEEIFEKDTECTKKQMLEECKNELKYLGNYLNDEFVAHITEDIYDDLDWACFSTYLDEYDVDECLVSFLEEHEDTIVFDKIGYFNDIDSITDLRKETAENVIEAIKDYNFLHSKGETLVADNLRDAEFSLTKDGKYLVIWDCDNECEDLCNYNNFIDVYKLRTDNE